MRLYLLSTFLAFLLNTKHGCSLPAADASEGQIEDTRHDAYEIQDGGSTIKFVNPIPEKPTLREIVYYHLMEKPYVDVLMSKKAHGVTQETPELSRPFTNSHGFQFSDDDDDDEVNGNSKEQEKNVADINDSVAEDISFEQEHSDIPKEKKEINQAILPTMEPAPISDLEAITVPSAMEVEDVRVRREVMEEIPEAPQLGPLDVSSLPLYMQRSISIGQSDVDDDADEDRMDDIRNRMRSVFDKTEEETPEEHESHPPKTYGMNLTNGAGYMWNDMFSGQKELGSDFEEEKKESEDEADIDRRREDEVEISKISEDDVEDDIEVHVDKKIEKPENIPGEEGEDDEDVVADEEDKNAAENEEIPDVEDKARKFNKHHKHNLEPLEELLEDQKFWNWLTDWTTVYLETLTDQVKEIIKDEVSRQLFVKETMKDIIPQKPEGTTEIQKPILNPVKEISEPEIKDGKLHIDGKEIPIVHSIAEHNKDADKMRKRNDKRRPNNQETSQPFDHKNDNVKVQAEKLYGNSIGNEKVTNIFIFYPNKESDDVLENLKPDGSSETDVFGKPEQINSEKEKEDKIEREDKDIITPTEISTYITTERYDMSESTAIPLNIVTEDRLEREEFTTEVSMTNESFM